MAVLAGHQAGKTPYQINGATDSRAPIRLGNSASALTPTTAQTITLPTDPQGNPYAAYILYAAGNIWWAFTNGTGNASPGGTGCYLLSGANILVVPPATPTAATSISCIFDASSTTGSLCVIGIY